MKLRKILTVLLIASAFAAGGAIQASAAVPQSASDIAVIVFGEDYTNKEYIIIENKTFEGDLNINIPITVSENCTLICNGNMYASSKINLEGGEVIVNGDLHMLQSISANEKGGKITVTGSLYQENSVDYSRSEVNVGGDFIHSFGTLTVGDGKLTVQGSYTSNSKTADENGELVDTATETTIYMTNADGRFTVCGDFTVNSNKNNASYNNYLTAGTIELKGNFLQMPGSNSNFCCNENHRVIFSGNKKQTAVFSSPTVSGFNIVETAAGSDVDITGSVRKIDKEVTLSSFNQYQSFSLNGNKLNVTGNMTASGNVIGSGGTLNVTGNYIQTGGALYVEDANITVGGDMRIQGIDTSSQDTVTYTSCDAIMQMTNENGHVTVGGTFAAQSIKNNASYNNYLTAGTLELKGDFLQKSVCSDNFYCRENHKVIFTGTKEQNIVFESPTVSGFNLLGSSSNANVNLTGSFAALDADVTIKNYNQYKTTSLMTHKLTVTKNVTANGTVNGNTGSMAVGGNYVQAGGAIYVNDAAITVNGDFRIQKMTENGWGDSEAIIQMTGADGHLTVGGTFATQSAKNNASYNNYLTAGTLELKGDFFQKSGYSDNFCCHDNHKVIFTGTKEQNIVFENPTVSGFNLLGASSNANVNLTGSFAALDADVTLQNYNQYKTTSLMTHKLTVTQNVTANGTVNGNTGSMAVGGNYVQAGGAIYVNDAAITVDGDFRIQKMTDDGWGASEAIIQMTGADGHLTVGGTFAAQSAKNNASYNNYLTAGTLELKGDFLQLAGNSDNFCCRDNHKVIFTGAGEQNIVFETPTVSGFNLLGASSNKLVNLTGSFAALDADVTIKNYVQYKATSLMANKLTVTCDLTANGTIYGKTGSMVVTGNYIQAGGALYTDEAKITVNGDFRIQKMTDDGWGNSDGIIQMTNANARLTVGGAFVTQSTKNDASYNNCLTAGTLKLNGDFRQIGSANSTNFACYNKHKVVFTGNKEQTAVFDSVYNSSFNILATSTNAKVNITGSVRSLGTDVTIKSFNQYQSFDLTTHTLKVTGDVVSNGNIIGNKGALTVSGNYTQANGGLYVNEGRIYVNGDFSIQTENDNGPAASEGILQMTNENGYLGVGGTFTTRSNRNDASYNNYLIAGTLELKGDFLQVNTNSYNFVCREKHRVIFSSESTQNIVFEAPKNSGFNIAEAAPDSIVRIKGRISKIDSDITLISFEQYQGTDLNGYKMDVRESMISHGSVKGSGGILNVGEDYVQCEGALYLENAKMTVGRDLRIQSIDASDINNISYGSCDAIIQMTNEKGRITVGGLFITQSTKNDASYNNYLTAGTLELKGDFRQVSANSGNFVCRDKHKVIFTGEDEQEIIFDNMNTSRFNIVSASTNDDITLIGCISKIDSDVTLKSFKQYQSLNIGSKKLTVTGGLISNGYINAETGTIEVNGFYRIESGALFVSEGTVTVDGDFRIQNVNDNDEFISSDGYLQMTNAKGYLCVGGCFATASSKNDASYNNYLTAGTLELKGDFYQYYEQSNNQTYNFVCRGEHRVIFSGDEHQTIVFESPTCSGFNILAGTPNTDTDVTARIFKLGANAKIGEFTCYGSLDLNGYNLEITDDLTARGNVNTDNSVLIVNGDVIAERGTFYVGSGIVRANNNFYICKITGTDDNGKPIFGDSNAVLQMINSNGVLYVGGDFATKSIHNDASYNNYLTAGTIELTGDFLQSVGNDYNFVCKNAHKTILVGSKKQTITFASPKCSHFYILDASFALDPIYYGDAVAARIITDNTLKNYSSISTTNCYKGDTVVVSAVAAGGSGGYGYAVYYKPSTVNSWTLIGTKYGASAVESFAAAEIGTYDVLVNIMDSEGTVRGKKFSVNVQKKKLTNDSTVSAEKVEAGTKVILNGAASGGTEEYTYALMYKLSSSNSWKTIGTKYGTKSTGTFTPDEPGTYDLLINIKDSSGTTAAKKFTLTVTESTALENLSTISESTITLGGTVTLSGAAKGGNGNYSYAFMYKPSTTTSWKVIGSKFDTNLTAEFTPTAIGKYDILITVKDVSGKTVSKKFELTVNESATALKNNSTISSTTVSAGTKVTLNAVGEGGSGDYTYALMYKLSENSSWKVIGTKYGTEDTGSFTPTVPGEYDILISVKDSSGKTAAKKFKLTVPEAAEALKNTSSISSNITVTGSKIALNGSAQGGSGEYTYAFMYKPASSSSWKTIGTKFGTESTQEFSSKTAGTYDILIKIKDSSGKTASKSFTVTVNKPLANNSTVSASTVSAGTAVSINAAAEGGVGGYTYAMMYKTSSSSSWKTIGTKYGTESTGSFTPTDKGSYDVLINVKDASGKTAAKKYQITVT